MLISRSRALVTSRIPGSPGPPSHQFPSLRLAPIEANRCSGRGFTAAIAVRASVEFVPSIENRSAFSVALTTRAPEIVLHSFRSSS